MSSHRVPRGNKSLLFLVLKMYPSHLILVFYFYFLENTSHIKLAISTISQCGVQRHPFASAGSRPPSPRADTVPVAAPAPRSSSATPPAWGRARQRSHTPRVLPCLAGHSASRFPASSAPPSSFGPAGVHRAHTSHCLPLPCGWTAGYVRLLAAGDGVALSTSARACV